MFQKATNAIYVDASGKEVRCVDLIVRDNVSPWYSGGVYVNNAAKIHIVGSTFFNNTSSSVPAQQIWFNAGAGTVVNTVVRSQGTGTMLAKASGATMTTNYDLVKGQTLTGAGSLAGSVDPKLRSDLHLLWDSPLRAAGGTIAQSRVDIDGELRPSSTPDIGVDQFNDVDSDGLADGFEIATAGNTTSIAGAADEDDDGLSNALEDDLETSGIGPTRMATASRTGSRSRWGRIRSSRTWKT